MLRIATIATLLLGTLVIGGFATDGELKKGETVEVALKKGEADLKKGDEALALKKGEADLKKGETVEVALKKGEADLKKGNEALALKKGEADLKKGDEALLA